jgi:hypothetical protein
MPAATWLRDSASNAFPTRRVDRTGSQPIRVVTSGEILIVAVALGLLTVLQLSITQSFFLFSRNFWLDELFTYTIVSDPDLSHALKALANGVETNPPTLHLLLKAFSVLFVSTEPGFRLFALVSMLAGLMGLYVVLRDAFSPLAAVAGVLAVWCHPLITHHAFEARFYGPWLAMVVWFAACLARALRRPGQKWFAVPLAVLSILVCTIHYFGIITLLLVTIPQLWIYRRQSRLSPGILAAVLCGPIALAACVSMPLTQRSALTVATWVAPITGVDVALGLLPLVAAGCLYILRGRLAKRLPENGDLTAIVGLLGLLLLLPGLTFFSITVQPAMVARYALPALLIVGILVAFLVQQMPRLLGIAVCGVLLAISGQHLRELVGVYRARDQQMGRLVAAIRDETGNAPVGFEFQHLLYVVHRYAPDLRSRCFFIEFDNGDTKEASALQTFARDAARQYAAFYGEPKLLPWQRYKLLPNRYLVPGHEIMEDPVACGGNYPGYALRPIRNGLYKLTREPTLTNSK